MKKQNPLEKKLTDIEQLLSAQAESQAAKPMTMNEAAEYLDISKSYLYKMTCWNKIPFYKPNGKKIYFTKPELDKWMCRKRIKTDQEIKDEVSAGKFKRTRRTNKQPA